MKNDTDGGGIGRLERFLARRVAVHINCMHETAEIYDDTHIQCVSCGVFFEIDRQQTAYTE